jgi:hypothetical protein
MARNVKIHIIAVIILVGFGLSVAYHYYRGFYLGQPYPYNTFLFYPPARFSDYFDVIRDSHSLDPYSGYQSAQYPFLVILGYLFSLISSQSYFFYLVLISGIIFLLSYLFLRNKNGFSNAIPVFTIAFLNYPFLFAMDRGNFESLLFVFLLIFMLFYTNKRYLISAVVLAFAISMKIYPAILLVLFISEKRFRETIICLASTVVITFASLLCFKGGFLKNLYFLIGGSNISSNHIFAQFTSLDNYFVQRGVSLLTFIKLYYIKTNLLPDLVKNNFISFYLGLVGILAVAVVLYVILMEKEEWKKVALLIFSMLLLPTISADYKLLYVFIPLFLFINKEHQSNLDILYLLLFGLLLIPKDYYFFINIHSDANGRHDISIAVVINILTMLIMSILIMVNGIKNYFSNLHIGTKMSDNSNIKSLNAPS